MLASLLGLWVLGTVGVRLEQTADVPLETGLEIERALVGALSSRLGTDVAIDSPDWAPCDRADKACIDGIRARMHADSVVVLRIFGAPTAIRLVVKLFGATEAPVSSELDLERSSDTWRAALDGLAKQLFPVVTRPAPAVTAEEPRAKEPKGFSFAPWAAFAGGAVCAGVGAYFMVRQNQTKNQLDAEFAAVPFQPGPPARSMANDYATQQTAANTLMSVAAAGAIAGAILLLLGD
jgi:hypothetical protein